MYYRKLVVTSTVPALVVERSSARIRLVQLLCVRLSFLSLLSCLAEPLPAVLPFG